MEGAAQPQPAGLIKDWLPRSKTQGIFAALLAGVMFPLCECGAMPVVQRLIRKGVPPAVATVYPAIRAARTAPAEALRYE